MADLPPRDICDYACEDADVTLQLMAPLKKEMEDNGLTRVFEQIEMPLMPVLARMEATGCDSIRNNWPKRDATSTNDWPKSKRRCMHWPDTNFSLLRPDRWARCCSMS
mgnify:CR=1 FL=1